MKTKNVIPFAVLALLMVLALVYTPASPVELAVEMHEYDTGDTAWMLMASALVLIMTPGLAFFYGGMVRKKNVISTMLQSFASMAIITVLWVFIGFSLAFGDSLGGIIGDPSTFFLYKGVWEHAPMSTAPTIPLALFSFFQLKFAIITPALITGAFAERIRFTSYMLFIVLFSLFIYAPLAHATWHPDGLLFNWGVLDFAGGTVVHISAGVAALASAMYLKGRHEQEHQPARITYVLLGTGLLWFGWFGFNAGSAFGANSLGVLALSTTTTASAAAAVTYILFDAIRGRKPSALGVCIGAVVGLVAITPAAGFVSIAHSLVIGFAAAIVSNMMIEWRTRSGIDDTLDVFPSHGVGGMVGMLMTGIFAADGLYYGHSALFLKELTVLVVVSVLVFSVTLLLLKITDLIAPIRVSIDDETTGLDLSQHDERL
ncbi:MAG: ammonium transporter [Bacteroidetes bacterium]|nr:MAG: ammonium transporter [Bacteroidota bacterium]